MIIEGIRIIINYLINDTAVHAMVGKNVFPHGIETETTTVYPCITIEIDHSENLAESAGADLGFLTVTAYSSRSYAQCSDITELLIGNAMKNISPRLHKCSYTKDNYNVYTTHKGIARQDADTIYEGDSRIVYWVESRWIMAGKYVS